MKPFILSAFLLVAGAAWGHADDGRDATMPSERRQVVADNRIIYGSKVNLNVWTIFEKGFEIAFAPRTFRKNWPFYGYAVPKNKKNTDLCGRLKERHPNLTVGKAAMVLSKEYDAVPDSTSFSYIGFPVKSVAIVDPETLVASTENRVVKSALEYPELRIRDVCSGISEKLHQTMLMIGALPYNLPGGTWINSHAPYSNPLKLMTGMVGKPDDTGTATPFVWSEAAETGRKIVWTPLFGGERHHPINDDYIWWRYVPESRSRGNYYLSWKGSKSDLNPKIVNWLLPSGKMKWRKMPKIANWPLPSGKMKQDKRSESDNLRFTMWYEPETNSTDHVMASAQTARKWYLLTEEPLPRLDADIRFKFHSAHVR